MGDVGVGDLVFTPEGEPTVIVDATEELIGRPCREVVFSDGTTVVCDISHQWVTSGRHEATAVTTGEIERTIQGGASWNHHVGVVHVPAMIESTGPEAGHCTAVIERVESRAIVAVRPVQSVRVRCIEVSSPAGEFLVTRSYIPTHNSSLGRLGLLIHSTAGFIDPGWDGHVTLELSNVANLPITIYHGMKIGQISFMQLSEPTSTPYGSSSLGSKYQGQRGPTPSRYWQNFSS
jgi:deoxycytidine triphosphate deaminase